MPNVHAPATEEVLGVSTWVTKSISLTLLISTEM